MKTRTSKFKMVKFCAKFAWTNLKLIGNISDFISQKAIEFIVHIALPECLYETAVREGEKY